MFYVDGTDEMLNQYFMQTRLPNKAFGRLVLVIRAVSYLIKEWSMLQTSFRFRDLFNRDSRAEIIDELTCFRYFNYAFGYMTEAEAEMQANIEAHLYHFELFDPCPTTFKFGEREFPYPAIRSDHYYGWGLIAKMICHTNYRYEESENV